MENNDELFYEWLPKNLDKVEWVEPKGVKDEPSFFNNELTKRVPEKPVTVTIGRSAMIGQEIRIASTNIVGVITEDSKTDTERIFTVKPIPTEDAEFEVIPPKMIENGK